MTNSLDRLFNPKSIAVFGGHAAEAVIIQCEKIGYAGNIWPVHPHREEIAGRRCFRSTKDLPAAPDAAFIGVNRNQSVVIAGQLSAAGCGGAVCYASGFKESGDNGLSEELTRVAGTMPVLGPNCYGFINYLDGALLWPDQHGGKRVNTGVAILMQSSNIAINLTMNRRALPIAYMIALGNQVQVGMSQVIGWLCRDSRVTAIGLHIEGLDDLSRFSKAILIAHRLGKPVVVLKTGRSETGAAHTITHTASLAGNNAVMDAVFLRLGIARVGSFPRFLETLKLLHVFGPLPDPGVASLSCSGGEASLISDAALEFHVSFTEFGANDIDRIRPTVNELVNISNPFDYHTFDWANRERLEATFTAVMESGKTLNLLIMDFPRTDRCSNDEWMVTLSAWQAAAKASGARASVCSCLPDGMPEDIADLLMTDGIVPLAGIEDSLAAIVAVTQIHADAAPYRPVAAGHACGDRLETLNEHESKQFLANYGIQVPDSCLCRSQDEVWEFIRTAGFPLVAKAVGRKLTHKTEQGAVYLDLETPEQVVRAMDSLAGISDKILIEKMIEDCALELIVGVNRDPVAGLHLLIGAGGVYTELLEDIRVLLLPLDEQQLERELGRLKAMALLRGYRGQPVIRQDRLVQALLDVERFVLDHKNSLVEMDINPLMVTRDGQAVAADAVIRLARTGLTD